MAWERRGENFYYYRSVREGAKVRKDYIGRGEVAQIIAHSDDVIRHSRKVRAERGREALDQAEGLASCAASLELEGATEVLARAQMVSAGYHRHKGEWRRRRDA